jgi:photoactive yellow protein
MASGTLKRSVDFDARDLAARIEKIGRKDVDVLPFGAIELDREGNVLFYSEAEATQSGYGPVAAGQNLYALSSCLDSDGFRGRITRAMEEGPVDLEFGWSGDYADPKRDLRIRVQSSSRGGVWICIERDERTG